MMHITRKSPFLKSCVVVVENTRLGDESRLLAVQISSMMITFARRDIRGFRGYMIAVYLRQRDMHGVSSRHQTGMTGLAFPSTIIAAQICRESGRETRDAHSYGLQYLLDKQLTSDPLSLNAFFRIKTQ